MTTEQLKDITTRYLTEKLSDEVLLTELHDHREQLPECAADTIGMYYDGCLTAGEAANHCISEICSIVVNA